MLTNEEDSDLFGMTILAAVWGITNTFIANAARRDKAQTEGKLLVFEVLKSVFLV